MAYAQTHVDRVLKIIGQGVPTPTAERGELLIQKSWLRCANHYGLDPALRPRIRIETAQRLRHSRDSIGDFLDVAKSGMRQLYRHVADLGYIMLIADAQGVTIDYIGNGDLDASLRGAGLTVGANWGEALSGTNGIGTCLAEAQTVTCHRDDHFYLGNISLSCTATPLRGPDGEILGALDVSAVSSPEQRESQYLVRRLTRLHGQMIENAYFVRRHPDAFIVRLGDSTPLSDVQPAPLLACDADGVVIGADHAARRRLNAVEDAGLLGLPLTEVLDFGAHDLNAILKPTMQQVRPVLRDRDGRAYHVSVLMPRVAAPLKSIAVLRPAKPSPLAALGANDATLSDLVRRAVRLVDRSIHILIQGETGAGKEVFARALHEASQRAARPFVAINCASLPESLIESELFGYAPGTFTGARSQGRKGLIQKADGGTLFLDEIGDMPLLLQSRLLRVIAENEVLPLGADDPIRVSLNVIAASHRDLRTMMRAGEFREDLYYRLCGAAFALPALRDRQDIEALTRTILAGLLGCEPDAVSIDAPLRDLFKAYAWPGNIRELIAVLRYASAVLDGRTMTLRDLPTEIGPLSTGCRRQDLARPRGPSDARDEDEARDLRVVLERHRWSVPDTAKDLGCSRATLYRRIKRLGIQTPRGAI
ncbi:sigma-54-dependent Fis family transcriptional regulator [Methylorubrum sp. Q1]|uniref:sigma-54-dependent Fis family transcriptional regulator n=1 Tax=Methylorubrum sp. Q1 TaxID=2562453 RepID=UPI00107657EA|nr:sigma-54-dependent Fis family transcriptional regulator [Methylorubrum sp. Q1]TFZ54885.1 sigma-54-dependent Fis family transcriptional regulator [Methylorubrum sp. Q1]